MDGVLFFRHMDRIFAFTMPQPSRLLILIFLWSRITVGFSQLLTGRYDPSDLLKEKWIVLYATVGNTHHAIDSTRISTTGEFAFSREKWPTGFYELGVGLDRVGLILGSSDKKVDLRFDGVPLQEHISVAFGEENQRLWEYKRASREAQKRSAFIQQQRAATSPMDNGTLQKLASEEAEVESWRRAALDRMILQDSTSYFARVVLTDRRLMASLEEGTSAIKNAVDWKDPGLVRSAVYEKGIMALLESATPASPNTLMTAADSILAWAAPDTTCWRFARLTLTNLFSTYGPPEVVQHIVDEYVAGPRSLVGAEPELMALVGDHLRVSIGSVAPDVLLRSPLRSDSTTLYALAKHHSATVLFFYSSTCEHCHAQMPGVVEVDRSFTSRGVKVIGLALDHDRNEFVENIERMHLTFDCFTDLDAWGSAAAKVFVVKATPSFVVIDDAMHIVGKPNDVEELKELLVRILR